jgi:cell division protein FtsB
MKKFLKYVKNKYIITLTAFIVWLLFFDKNDTLSQVELTKKLNELNKEKQYYVDEIAKNKQDMIELKTNPKNLEKFAREKYLMKKDNEEIFVIVEEDDSSSVKTN